MTTTVFAPARRAVHYGFILAQQTLCQGVIPAERDGENQPVIYDTRAQAEAERGDAAEMRADALADAKMAPDEVDDGPWVEAAVLHPDGALTLLDAGLTLTAETLRELVS